MKKTARYAALTAYRKTLAGKPVAFTAFDHLSLEDAAFAKALVEACLRHAAFLSAVLATLIAPKKSLKPAPLNDVVLLGLAQIFLLSTPPHAATGETVNLARADGHAHAAGLVNALLRRALREKEQLEKIAYNPLACFPAWLKEGLQTSLLPAELASFLNHTQTAPALDVYATNPVFVPSDSSELAPNSFRVHSKDKVETLEGYETGTWWVQDLASTLPVRLVGDASGKTVLDVCAAPGGKSMQLASLGATVSALDNDAGRVQRMKANFDRTKTNATCIVADAFSYTPATQFDVVVLDAPCSATGTLRRHPELPFIHSQNKLPELLALQKNLLERCATWVKPNGKLVYAVCSILQAEGEEQLKAFLTQNPYFKVTTPPATLASVFATCRLESGAYLTGTTPTAMNGFYAVLLEKTV